MVHTKEELINELKDNEQVITLFEELVEERGTLKKYKVEYGFRFNSKVSRVQTLYLIEDTQKNIALWENVLPRVIELQLKQNSNSSNNVIQIDKTKEENVLKSKFGDIIDVSINDNLVDFSLNHIDLNGNYTTIVGKIINEEVFVDTESSKVYVKK